MKFLMLLVGLGSSLLSGTAMSGNSESEFPGRWEITTTYSGGTSVVGLDLAITSEHFLGRSGYLVPDFAFPYRYDGGLQKDGLHLIILAPDGATPIGNLVLHLIHGALHGEGNLHGLPIVVSGRRPLARPAGASAVHTFEPKVWYRTFSGSNPPVLRIFPGDTVRTKTLDSSGVDEHGVQRAFAGNPQTGPFYVEGAMVGDTIAVRFDKIRLNRDSAFQYRASLAPGVLPPGYPQAPAENWSNRWKLDIAHGTASPERPSDKLARIVVKLIPMLGCVSVAPYWNQAFDAPQLGVFGGNMDYNRIEEGTTLYMPVFQAGALLTVGDGHALQADGEVTGQGLETSMDVEFTVNLIRNQILNQPWAENDAYVMVSGIGESLNDALQLATAGLANWLRVFYGLNASEVATVLSVAVKYDVAEVTDPQFHVVAKIGRDVLRQLPAQASDPVAFCTAQSGCMP